jgi:hypothetical protein
MAKRQKKTTTDNVSFLALTSLKISPKKLPRMLHTKEEVKTSNKFTDRSPAGRMSFGKAGSGLFDE